jgi:hypothetical protein
VARQLTDLENLNEEDPMAQTDVDQELERTERRHRYVTELAIEYSIRLGRIEEAESCGADVLLIAGCILALLDEVRTGVVTVGS